MMQCVFSPKRSALALVSGKSLDGGEIPVIISEHHQFVTQFAEEVGVLAVPAENHMPGAELDQACIFPRNG